MAKKLLQTPLIRASFLRKNDCKPDDKISIKHWFKKQSIDEDLHNNVEEQIKIKLSNASFINYVSSDYDSFTREMLSDEQIIDKLNATLSDYHLGETDSKVDGFNHFKFF